MKASDAATPPYAYPADSCTDARTDSGADTYSNSCPNSCADTETASLVINLSNQRLGGDQRSGNRQEFRCLPEGEHHF